MTRALRSGVARGVPMVTAVILAAGLNQAFPSTGGSPARVVLTALALAAVIAPLVAAWLYARNVRVEFAPGSLLHTDLIGRPRSIPVSRLVSLVALTLQTPAPLPDLHLVQLRSGQGDELHLFAAAWSLTALDRLADELRLPVVNEVTSAGSLLRPAGGRRLRLL